MIIPEIPLAQSILQLFKAKNIQHIIISPGSRNAPLTIGFASDPFFKCYSIADERSAAFFAMGIAQQLQQPTAVICTSGSAVLNFYPAVAEAFYSQIPLIVVSADRPANKIDIGDGQTIRQVNVLANHTVFNANLSEKANQDNDQLIQKAIQSAIDLKGPVHINVPFEEPLYQTQNDYSYFPEIIPEEQVISREIVSEEMVLKWQKATKKLVLVGVQNPDELSKETIALLANDSSVLIMTEITSNLHHPNFIEHIDTLITSFNEQDFKEFQPDLLLTIGGMVVSKRIKALLRNYPASQHWHIDPLRAYDTFGYLTHQVKTTPELFFTAVYKEKNITSDYQSKYVNLLQQKKEKQTAYLQQAPFSDLKVFEQLSRFIPAHSQLHISNSAGIRYAMLFPFDPNIRVFCNRGTSGIDGCTSTAVGAATTTSEITTLVTGDVSFFYDSNALWNHYLSKNLKIIVINNGGGGIFRILPGHQENVVFNTYFETEHQLTAQYLATMYGLDYIAAKDEQQTTEALQKIYAENEQPVILEIFTPTKENQNIQKEYFKSLEL
ncbi:MAG TPA: 2-succinyl-5-enolpyruvyl-6-hydroxy-3-cyclohexene-1-carboxylic-acid synthase [Flavobacterium sp.]|nr:2-succinyl-5-enolpyruvyl-6-hydroxy-3-cyclohexene-1-carboxylic-acid synthase [Flavobacterium sp.]